MLVLLHGSGDDDSKVENWMPHVAALMEFHGDLAVVLPGVGSGERSEVMARGVEFCRRLKSKWERFGRPPAKTLACNPTGSLHTSLSAGINLEALRGFRGALNFENAIELIENLKQDDESDHLFGAIPVMSGNGIKFRATIAAICAILYEGYMPDDARKVPLRIVGHSRGGSTAITTHNMCDYWGLTPSTLALDPCHGLMSWNSNKLHWHNVWGGKVVNIPVVKQVGGLPGDTTKRLPITAHSDGDADVVNHEKLGDIKHGHMGKLKAFEDGDKKTGREALKTKIGQYLIKAAQEASLKAKTPAQLLETFYEEFGAKDDDRRFIWRHLVATVAFPMPA